MASLSKGYSGLFGIANEEGEETTQKNNSEGFQEYWGWHLILDSLSNHDRTKWEFFYSMNIIEFLNCISFFKDKQKWEHEQNKIAIRNAKNRQ